MGLFDFFKARPMDRAIEAAQARVIRKASIQRLAAKITRLADPGHRMDAIDALLEIGTEEAIVAVLRRFTFTFPSSIIDHEEKDAAFRGIVGLGEVALPAIRELSGEIESLGWPLRMMKAILDDRAYVGEVLALLAAKDTDYARHAEPKVQLLSALEDYKDARIRPVVERFLEDVHEPTRYHAVGALLAQNDPGIAVPLMKAFFREEAWRTQNRIVLGLVERAWPLPEETRGRFADIATAFRIDAAGVLHSRR